MIKSQLRAYQTGKQCIFHNLNAECLSFSRLPRPSLSPLVALTMETFTGKILRLHSDITKGKKHFYNVCQNTAVLCQTAQSVQEKYISFTCFSGFFFCLFVS